MLPPHVFAIGEHTILLLVVNNNSLNLIMLFAGWEVRILKNCDQCLENTAAEGSLFKSKVTVFHYIWTGPKPVNNLFIFFVSLSNHL